jgi:hypothetical protein
MNETRQDRLRLVGTLVLALGLALATACASSGRHVKTLGFLDDYAQLSPGRAGQASLIYIDAEADFSTFSAIVVDPVAAWAEPGSEPTAIDRKLAQDLGESMRRELAREFELVDQTRAGALRLRSALASDEDSHLTLEVELLDGGNGQRLIAAVDRRELETSGTPSQTDAWAVLIRNRLASFRQFDAAARERAGEPSTP